MDVGGGNEEQMDEKESEQILLYHGRQHRRRAAREHSGSVELIQQLLLFDESVVEPLGKRFAITRNLRATV